mmetsp:Transcript_12567/g.17538  ORF Transcript_12567/g.17538 Transcript_12567/m.17538 type:complete len:192 (+) Transcript_12567:617-1192(+)
MIKMVGLQLGIEVEARSSKIVSGLEVRNTNILLLQLVALAASHKPDSAAAVQAVLGALRVSALCYPRLEFAQYVLEVKASLGNSNAPTKKVVVVPRDCVLAWKDGFRKFEDCQADEHVVAADLTGISEARIPFFSHRWQNAPNSQADSLTSSMRCSRSTWSPPTARGSPICGWTCSASTRTGALLKASGSF